MFGAPRNAIRIVNNLWPGQCEFLPRFKLGSEVMEPCLEAEFRDSSAVARGAKVGVLAWICLSVVAAYLRASATHAVTCPGLHLRSGSLFRKLRDVVFGNTRQTFLQTSLQAEIVVATGWRKILLCRLG